MTLSMPFELGLALARPAIRCTRKVILVLKRCALPYEESVKSSPLHASQLLTPPGKIVRTVCQNRRFFFCWEMADSKASDILLRVMEDE